MFKPQLPSQNVIAELQERIAAGAKIENGAEVEVWDASNTEFLKRAFGINEVIQEYKKAKLDITIDINAGYRRVRDQKIHKLNTILADIESG